VEPFRRFEEDTLDKTGHYLAQIDRFYPNFHIESARLSLSGQYNDILIVNKTWIFRFPKYEESIQTFEVEMAVLQAIQQHVSLRIPNPQMHSQGTSRVGEVFSGYQLISGEPLWRDRYNAIRSEDARDGLAGQAARFLRRLHSIPSTILPAETPAGDKPGEWQRMYADIQHLLFPSMQADARQQVAAHFETFLETTSLQQFEPCLRHGDFGPSNILYDPIELRITGIIDFASVALGDPAVDIASASTYGEDFLERLKAYYPLTEAMQARADFYRGTFALQDALHGIKNGDQEAFESGMAAYVHPKQA